MQIGETLEAQVGSTSSSSLRSFTTQKTVMGGKSPGKMSLAVQDGYNVNFCRLDQLNFQKQTVLTRPLQLRHLGRFLLQS